MASCKALAKQLAVWPGTIGEFSQMLDQEKIAYLSFSKIACVEFCEYRYFLEYVKLEAPSPTADCFIKGQAFHETVAVLYRDLALNRPVDTERLVKLLRETLPERIEVENAIRLRTTASVRSKKAKMLGSRENVSAGEIIDSGLSAVFDRAWWS
jgi:hypothetical protein